MIVRLKPLYLRKIWSQSLIHQGTYSNVKKVSDWLIKKWEEKSQSLIHQGTYSNSILNEITMCPRRLSRNPLYIRGPIPTNWRLVEDTCWYKETVSQSLIHQGTYSNHLQGLFFIFVSKFCRNPLYIRGPIPTACIFYFKGGWKWASQSLIHQGTYSNMRLKRLIQIPRISVAIPYTSGDLFQHQSESESPLPSQK